MILWMTTSLLSVKMMGREIYLQRLPTFISWNRIEMLIEPRTRGGGVVDYGPDNA